MKLLYALAFSIATLVAFWVFLSVGNPQLKLNPWIGFIAWAAFFAAGGGIEGIRKSLPAGLAGIILTALTLFGVAALGGDISIKIGLIAALAFILVAMADIGFLAYTPAAFLGAASFFGSGGKVDSTILSILLTWCIGILFGFISEKVGLKIARPA